MFTYICYDIFRYLLYWEEFKVIFEYYDFAPRVNIAIALGINYAYWDNEHIAKTFEKAVKDSYDLYNAYLKEDDLNFCSPVDLGEDLYNSCGLIQNRLKTDLKYKQDVYMHILTDGLLPAFSLESDENKQKLRDYVKNIYKG